MGFESKLNVLGLCEWDEAVVELGYHILASLPWFGMDPRREKDRQWEMVILLTKLSR